LHRAGAEQRELPEHPQVISAAEITNVDAIHPGYGFLSENATLPRSAKRRKSRSSARGRNHRNDGGKGPRATGSEDRRPAHDPGSEGIVTGRTACQRAARIGYPLILKPRRAEAGAACGWCASRMNFYRVPNRAQRGAASLWDAGRLRGKILEHPRHIEFQVLGDSMEGNPSG